MWKRSWRDEKEEFVQATGNVNRQFLESRRVRPGVSLAEISAGRSESRLVAVRNSGAGISGGKKPFGAGKRRD